MRPNKIFVLSGTFLIFFILIILLSNHLIHRQLAQTLPLEQTSTQVNQKNIDQSNENGNFLSHQKTFLIDPEEDLLAPMKKTPKSTFADPSSSEDHIQEPSTKSPILIQ